MQKNISLVVADIEGCITKNKLSPIDVGHLVKIQAFCELARRGIRPPLVLCTGRPQPYAEAIIQALDAFFPNYPSIVENGAFLYDPVADILIENPAISAKGGGLKKLRSDLIVKFVESGKAKLEPGKEICISFNPLGGQTVEELFAEVKKCVGSDSLLANVAHSSSAVDVTPSGINKAAGLIHLAERTGIPFEEMLGIGDTNGDIPFLEKVGVPACPANASKEVKDLVAYRNGYVAKAAYTAGVWDILLNFELIEE